MKNWNEFQAACKIAWGTEGQEEKEVHNYLRRVVQTNPGQISLQEWASIAYEDYKADHDETAPDNRYFIGNTGTTVIAKSAVKAAEEAERLGVRIRGRVSLAQKNVP